MKIGILGGNGDVGSELALRLRSSTDHTICPIVRNPQAAGFLDNHGFDYRIANVVDKTDAKRALSDLDGVLINARKPVPLLNYQDAFEYNMNIIQNTIRYSQNDCKVIYASSQAAYGKKLTGSNLSRFNPYVKEKRTGEQITLKADSIDGYVFRYGAVSGKYQSWTNKIIKEVKNASDIEICVEPNKNSNFVHILTLQEALLKCLNGELDSGTYTLVNSPQWTWREVFEYYTADEVNISYIQKNNSKTTRTQRVQNRILDFLSQFQDLAHFAPNFLLRKLIAYNNIKQTRSDIQSFENKGKRTISFKLLDRNGLDESNIPNLTNTRELIEQSGYYPIVEY